MQAVNTQVDRGTFADFDDLLFDLLLYLGDHLLDSGRVDTSVGYEPGAGPGGRFRGARDRTRSG